jgi:hypothetical protein
MRTRAKGTSRAAVLAAGFVALGVTAIPSTAFADATSGNGGILSGNQVDAPISIPVDVSGNAAALLGTGRATSHGGATVHKRGGGGQKTSGAHGIASGNQVNAPISVPVNVCGNAVGVLGHADAGCTGGAKVTGGGGNGQVTDGSHGVIAGNQINAPISIPVNVCGNAVAIAGDAVAGCEGGAAVKHAGNTGSGQRTSGIFGVGSGNQGNLPISVPVDVCGNAVGNAAASCAGGASVHGGGRGTGRQTTGGAFGIIAGNQADAPISIPATVCGNAAGLVGQAWAFCEGGAHVHGSHGGSGTQTSGAHGAGGGNQASAPVQIPAEVCGNAAAIVGTASALCENAPGYGGSDGYDGDDGYNGGDGYNGDDGYGGYYRTAGVPMPAAFPALPGVATDLPATPGGLPSLPSANARHAAHNVLPGTDVALPQNTLPQLDGVPSTGELTQVGGLQNLLTLPPANGRTAPGSVLTTDGIASATHTVLADNTLPGNGGLPAGQDLATGPDGLATTGDLGSTDGLSKLAGLPMANHRAQSGLPGTDDVVAPNALPKLDGVSALNGRRVPANASAAHGILPATALPKGLALNGLSTPEAAATNGLPGVDGLVPAGLLPAVGGPARDMSAARQGGAPVAVSVLDTRALPGGGAVRRPIGLRAVDALRSPARVAVPATPVTGHEIVPVTGEIGPVRNVAAEEPVSDGAGSLWALAASGVLGVLAGALTLARRVRLDGRR